MDESRAPGHDIVVVGASAGGLQGLVELVRGLPEDLPASVFVVVHTSPNNPGVLPQILDRAGPLPAAHAVDNELIRPGRIYVAPSDRHLVVKRKTVRVGRGPQENGFRPAIDPLFRTAARAHGERVVGVILSGALDDGTHGLAQIKRHGGVAIVQDPAEAVIPAMPLSAIETVSVDHVLRVRDMPEVLTRLAREPITDGHEAQAGKAEVLDVAEIGMNALAGQQITEPPSAFTCPACGGALWELQDGNLLDYRCHVGHAFTADSLLTQQSSTLDAALWTALRALEEHVALYRRMAQRAYAGALTVIAEGYEQRARDVEARAAIIRGVLTGDPVNETPPAERPAGHRPRRRRRQRIAES